ncbi:hypothetical protein SKAU_G00110860 [Synaphobranchus kaupii]|uniref:Uncharacterized protein n=1 Tax=Synaphobranchus kaupii TaxID=118154 RepID=A0A9Q1J8F8_SYNKA|nr:hypothetical protein SKAU_G00110860 [Synaphobranchus kaupii]
MEKSPLSCEQRGPSARLWHYIMRTWNNCLASEPERERNTTEQLLASHDSDGCSRARLLPPKLPPSEAFMQRYWREAGKTALSGSLTPASSFNGLAPSKVLTKAASCSPNLRRLSF